MEINYKHPAFAVWHLAEEPIKIIPYGALIKWFDQVIQFGFHLGCGEIAWRDGVISAKDLKIGASVSWHDKECVCILGRNGRAVVFGEAAARAGSQAGLHAARRDFICACLGEDIGDWGNFPVWIFGRYGKCFWHPVARKPEYETGPREKF